MSYGRSWPLQASQDRPGPSKPVNGLAVLQQRRCAGLDTTLAGSSTVLKYGGYYAMGYTAVRRGYYAMGYTAVRRGYYANGVKAVRYGEGTTLRGQGRTVPGSTTLMGHGRTVHRAMPAIQYTGP